MIVTPIKTDKILPLDHNNLLKILEQFLPEIKENSVLAVTSKIVAICEDRVFKIREYDKDQLIGAQAQYYLPREDNLYDVSLTVTNNNLVASAGIDESNGGGFYILWPKDSQRSANQIRKFLKDKYNLNNIGVIITDSRTTPMRWGVTAFALAYSGFNPLKDYTGKPDIFGRKFHFEKMSIIDNLACSAALVMGEGAEQTPMALIEDLPFVEFQDREPAKEELDKLKISLEEDIYSPFLRSAPWKKGQGV